MEENKEQKEKIKRLRNQGLSYGAIAKMVGLSRARVHQISSGYKAKKNIPYEISRIRKGVLVRDDFKCQWEERCKGKKVEIKDLVVHHIDFNDRNNVSDNMITLCRFCHLFFHRQNHIEDKVEKRLNQIEEVTSKAENVEVKKKK